MNSPLFRTSFLAFLIRQWLKTIAPVKVSSHDNETLADHYGEMVLHKTNVQNVVANFQQMDFPMLQCVRLYTH